MSSELSLKTPAHFGLTIEAGAMFGPSYHVTKWRSKIKSGSLKVLSITIAHIAAKVALKENFSSFISSFRRLRSFTLQGVPPPKLTRCWR